MVVYRADCLKEFFLGDFVDKDIMPMFFKSFDDDEAKKAAWDEVITNKVGKALDVFEKYAPEEGKLLLGDKVSMLDIQLGTFFALMYQAKEEDKIAYAK